MNKFFTYLKAIIIPVAVGGVVGFITSKSMDYEMLQKPFLSPPSILFPIVWTILYVLMGVSYGRLKEKSLVNENIRFIYYLQLAVNAFWPIFFFVLKWRLFAFIWIVLLAILVLTMVIKFYNKEKIAGLLQIPYLVWVLFASYLNLAIYLLNK